MVVSNRKLFLLILSQWHALSSTTAPRVEVDDDRR